MHVFFINKYQIEFTESFDKTYIDIFLKHGLLNFHGTFPYFSPAHKISTQINHPIARMNLSKSHSFRK